jgi:MFS family permease
MVVVAPFLGRLCDRIGVLKLGALSFLTLSLFPLLLILVPGDLGLYLAFGVYGLGMSGVFLVWSLGPMHMAGSRDPLPYLNAHMGLVGFRALVGLVGGTLLQQHLGSRAVFVVVIALEIVAAVLILRLARRTPVAPRPSSPGPP